MTAAPDHRHGFVTLACSCGTVLELPPIAAEAARPLWDRTHSGPRHGPVDAETARTSTFHAFLAAAERCGS